MNKFDQVVSGAIDIAQSEALKRKNTELHAEHLLWGLLQNKSSYAHKALKDVASEIEALITRGVKCCQTGNFWKACVAPIARKWREWKNNKEKSILPNEQNLPLYINNNGVV